MSAQGDPLHIIVRLRDQTGEEVVFRLKKDIKMYIVLELYAARKGVEVSHIRFFMAGDSNDEFLMADASKEIDDSMHMKTPEMLDINDGDRIDCIWPQNHGQNDDDDSSLSSNDSNDSNDNYDKNPNYNDGQRKEFPAVEYDLICPIALQLPFDPVMAEDGRIYERSAIEDYIKSKEGMVLKSPMTRKRMGTKLIPSPQTKNIIETLIATNVITGDLANYWQEQNQDFQDKQKQKLKKMDELIKKAASSGDSKLMFNVGWNYHVGQKGFPQNLEMAYSWYEKAHLAGDDVCASYKMATMLLTGVGVPKNLEEGRVHLQIAATGGNGSAAYDMGIALADGKYGFPVNEIEAIFWLKKVMTSSSPSASEHTKMKAMDKLEMLEKKD